MTVMEHPRGVLSDLVRQALYASCAREVQPHVRDASKARFGDYQSSAAIALARSMRGGNAMDVAQKMVDHLPANSMFLTPEVVQPGFVNFRLSPRWVSQKLTDVVMADVNILAPKPVRRSVVIDFSSPNVAKQMHVGHLRSTIIGDCVARCVEFTGANVTRLNHVGDWGTPLGMLLAYLEDSSDDLAVEDISDLHNLYKASKQKFDACEQFQQKSRLAVKQLQLKKARRLSVWAKLCEVSRRDFQQIYDRLDVKLIERGESFYQDMLPEIVTKLRNAGVAQESYGALAVIQAGQQTLVVQKQDGAYAYATTDFAALEHRARVMLADWIIYVTDVGQAQHFGAIFEAGRKAQLVDSHVLLSHVGFGIVTGIDGKRIKSRSGDSFTLVDLLDEARDRCKRTIREHRPEVSQSDLENAARIMGYGAVKYADLKNNLTTNYKFSMDSMLSLRGNTAVYLLYAYARICSIIKKSGVDGLFIRQATLALAHPSEVQLATRLVKFTDVVADTISELSPNRLTDYIYALSIDVSAFHRDCQVIGHPESASRLLLCESCRRVFRKSLDLLGIGCLDNI